RDEAANKRHQLLLNGFVMIGVLCAIGGFLISNFFGPTNLPPFLKIISIVIVLLFIALIWKFGVRRLDDLDRAQRNYQRGAEGESTVGSLLAKFPDDFRVINDLTTPFGNLDHIVIGPTGVFVLDTKNWRGVVSSDGKGELLHNGKATSKPIIRQFTGRIMGVRDKVRILVPAFDPFYHGVFVFPAARVEAKWGTTRTVNCITTEQLHHYIVEKDFGKRLQKEEVDHIAQAFLGLAHMDRGFNDDSALGFGPRQRVATPI
ncbi:MAG: nuclease-related domain-containing protein, partial [Verrucomicrobiota bacterium]